MTQYIFITLFAICIYCSGKVSVKVFGLFFFFFNGLPFFLLFSFKSSFYILENRLLRDLPFANIFSHSMAYILNFLDIVFHRAEIFILMKYSLLVFSFMDHSFHVTWENVTTKRRVVWVFSYVIFQKFYSFVFYS